MSDPADLINVAVEALSKSNIELPAFSTLDRLIGNIRRQVHEEMYARITSDLDSGQGSALDALLVVPEGERITEFARLKETPGPATLTNVRNWTERLTELEAIPDPRPFIENIPHTKIRQFAVEATALEVGDLRDVCQPGKRYTLLLCFLHETRTSTRDELIEMFLRRMRKTRKAAREELQELQEKHRAIEENLLGVFGQVLQRASFALGATGGREEGERELRYDELDRPPELRHRRLSRSWSGWFHIPPLALTCVLPRRGLRSGREPPKSAGSHR